MPYLCEIEISGPRSEDEGGMVADAVLAAVQEGWRSPKLDFGDVGAELNAEAGEATVLDYQVLGYPGGAFVLVVIPDVGLDSAALAAASLARHLTTWSPGLLEYTVDKLLVTPIDEPYDEENWLPPFTEPEPAPRTSLSELLGDEVRSMGARYLLAGALPSFWYPATSGMSPRAEDIVNGATEPPWNTELTDELATMLLRAGRVEADAGTRPRLIVRGSGDVALAEDLLGRIRALVEVEGETDRADTVSRGRLLLASFAADNDLDWDSFRPGESDEDHDERSGRQLRELLWAGLRVLATLATPLSTPSGIWGILHALGDDEAVEAYARWENDEFELSVENDVDEIVGASAVLAALWIAIRHPELLDDFNADLLDVLEEDTSPLIYLACSTLLLAGSGPTGQAVAEAHVPESMREALTRYADALAATENGDEDDGTDHFEELLQSAEAVLGDGDGDDLAERSGVLLNVVGLAARLVGTDPTPRQGIQARITNARALTVELLAHPARHGIVLLDNEKVGAEAIRLYALAAVADADPGAGGELAADFPDLTGEDPRTEPAARERARQWILTMLDMVGETDAITAGMFTGTDAFTVVEHVRDGRPVPSEWTVERVISAAATAVADLARAYDLGEELRELFAES